MKDEQDNFALVDSRGVIEDYFVSYEGAKEKFHELCEEGFIFGSGVCIVNIIEYLS